MPDTPLSTAELDAAAALERLAEGPGRDAASAISRAFEETGEVIARELARAAARGELSLKRLASVAAAELAKIALEEVFSLPRQGGAGARTPSSGYSGLGSVPSYGGPNGLTINLVVNGVSDATGFAEAQGRIAANLAEAVRDGGRYL